ncbi:transcriptional repressor LexA [Heliobacterium gestii]|uniref:LexA repressor n=1 Tax=Heliomicrobium gestii TaxID=2699 RepID=A0A845LAN2_HELGE|nr:repressor LexA [Heliomicrobium gestii]MZP43817.1 transcriptional repressor LexA [Heliomicrobium gestii]
MFELSERQKLILNYIRTEIRRRGYPPSVREIGDAVGLTSSSTVHGHLNRLEKAGFIRRDPAKPRALEVLAPDEEDGAKRPLIDIPILGRISAGRPILATENIENTFPLPLDFIRSDQVFILTVRGESMINAGIHDGDLVIVRIQQTADNGDIVVALLGDEATVKRFFKEKDYYRLQPENDYMEPILIKEVHILGKVIALLRKF